MLKFTCESTVCQKYQAHNSNFTLKAGMEIYISTAYIDFLRLTNLFLDRKSTFKQK